MIERECVVCKTPFTPGQDRRTTCSNGCRHVWRRWTKAGVIRLRARIAVSMESITQLRRILAAIDPHASPRLLVDADQ